MFNDANAPRPGGSSSTTHSLGLRLPQGRGRSDTKPPAQEELARMVELADELTPPSFAAYLDTLAHSGARPGEWDALRRTDLDYQAGEILIERHWHSRLRNLRLPKHNHVRTR